MIKIKFPDQLPPEIEEWKLRAAEITALILAETELTECHRLIDIHKNHWRKPELINWLSSLSSDKCWYTETKFGGDYQEVEHFRPKKETKETDGRMHQSHRGYYWLAFDLNNYRLCKNRPNRKKGTFFPIIDERNRACNVGESCGDELPLFLDPLNEADCLLISFDDNGKPVPEIDITARDKERVLFTIDKYFLDEGVLNTRRMETWKTARLLYYKYLHDTQTANAGAKDEVALRTSARKDLEALIAMLKPDKEFSSVAKAALIKTNEAIACKIAAQ